MSDRDILRKLAAEYMEIAQKPVQEEKRRLWRKLNAKTPERPMVMIDQVCWNELNFDGSLTLACAGEEARGYEQWLKRKLFQWKHFPVDMVVEAEIPVYRAIRDTGFGLDVEEKTLMTDATSEVLSHKYLNQLAHEDDLAKIQMPVVTHDAEETARRLAFAEEMFNGIAPLALQGYDPYLSVWDPISTWMGMEALLYGLVDRPEFMLKLAERVVAGYMARLDQMEALGILTGPQQLIHCTGAYTDELPAPGYEAQKPRTKDIWMFGLAQPFSTVSPAMFEEFEIETSMPIFARFGLVYYGCCDPLDRKMDEVKRIPHLRKVSMSPWVNEMRGAEAIGGDFVYSRKPNPALLAAPTFSEELVRDHLTQTREACRAFGCPVEFILKDISTVGFAPERLFRWAKIAMEVAHG